MDTSSIENSDLSISREVNGEMLVLDERAQVIHQLNPTASFIWQQAQRGSTADGIAAALAEQYDVSLETAHRDVASTLARLKELNLVGPKPLVYRTKANCLRVCTRGPIAVVYPEAVWYTYVDRADIDEIIDRHVVGGEIVERLRI